MFGRVLALTVALVTGAVGVIPSTAGHRCIWMGERMAPQHECCPERPASGTTIGKPCCESIAEAVLAVRANTCRSDSTIAPSPLVGVLSFAVVLPSQGLPAELHARASARGRPPGRRR